MQFDAAAESAVEGAVLTLDVTGLSGKTIDIDNTNSITINLVGNLGAGTLTVDAPSATVNNSAINGTFFINNVSGNTWNENANGNKLVLNDIDGDTKINIGATNTVNSLTLNKPATVTVPAGAAVSTLTVNSDADNSTITNNGTVTNLEANAAVEVAGNTPETVTGSASNDVTVSVSVSNHEKLVAALNNSKIKNIMIDGTIGSVEKFEEYNVDRAVTIKGAENNKVYGTFNIKETGVTLEGLNLFVRGGSASPATLKTGVNILTNEAKIKNNVFELLNPNAVDVGNGLAIWSLTAGQTNFDISGNTFKSFEGNSPGWSSTAILVVEGLDMERFGMAGTLSKEITVNDFAIATGNTYVGGTYAYMHHNYSGNNPGVSYGYARTSGNLGAIIRDASDGATVLLANDIVRDATGITVNKDVTLTGGYKVTLLNGVEITVASEKTLTIGAGTTVEGTIAGDGNWTGKDTVVLSSHLTKAASADYNNGNISNWMDIAKLTVEGTTVTADFSHADYNAIKAIYNGLGDKNVEGKVTGADDNEKDAYLYAIDSYVMNTFSRYVGALHRADNGQTVKKINFNGADYVWDGTAKGSNWKNLDATPLTLVSQVVSAQASSIRDVTLTINGVEVNFKAVTVPTKEAIWTELTDEDA